MQSLVYMNSFYGKNKANKKEHKTMKITRVLNIEDTMSKHVAVRRSLGKCGINDNIIDHATTAMEGRPGQ